MGTFLHPLILVVPELTTESANHITPSQCCRNETDAPKKNILKSL